MFYALHKPIGISSFDVIRKLRKMTGIKKMGHTGTLDPLATGVMVIATENSTKLIPYLENAEKRYVFTLRCDAKTESLDLATALILTNTETYISRSTEELKDFLLSQASQIPPRYSALNIEGKRAYELAREGINFEIQRRPIHIRDVEILESNFPTFTIELTISSGGYIRSLAPVIAEFLGVKNGGYITKLHRKSIIYEGCIIDESMTQNLESFDNARNIGYDFLFPNIPVYPIDMRQHSDIVQGKSISLDFLDGEAFLKFGEFITLGTIKNNLFTIIRNNV